MVMTDPIADMLTRLRNAASVKTTTVKVPDSKLKRAIAKVLIEEKWLTEAKPDDRELVLELASVDGKIRLSGLKRISKPGRRVYAPAGRLPRVRHGLGVAVISTPQGVMTADQARRRKLGGEVLLEVF